MDTKPEIRFIDFKLRDAFLELEQGKSSQKDLKKWIESGISKILINSECGVQIPKKLWPKYYTDRIALDNLWKLNLPSGWRIIYTLKAPSPIFVAIVLEWLSHSDYEKRFKY